MSTTLWTEAEPARPVPAGDVGGDDAVTEGFSRRFYRAGEKPDEWLTADVTYYYAREAAGDGGVLRPVMLMVELDLAIVEGENHDIGRETLRDIRYIEVSECDGEPTEDKARAACAAFDVDAIAWDGTWPVSDEHWTVG